MSGDVVERLRQQSRDGLMSLPDDFEMVSYAEAADLIAAMKEALTPSAETKAAYIGEFQFTVTMMELDESDEPYECQRMVTVPWTTIKEIMAAISARTLTNGGENGR